MKSFTALFCMSLWIEMAAEALTDTFSMKALACFSVVLLLFLWQRRRRRPWWEDDHWR